MDTFKKKLFLGIYLVVTVLFCYFRLSPIIHQTIPYTFDQGRDFLKVEEIVRYHNITFIGPTTGIQGLFHGAWWYYFLAIPYFVSQANPIGFAVFIFILSLLQYLLFSWFLKKELGSEAALVFAAVVATSPYFISTSIFVISSMMTLPFILLFFFFLYRYLENKNPKYLFLQFLSLGFVLESELPTGLFLIPAFLLAIVALREFRKFFPKIKYVLIALAGLLIPVVPRILFEVKNNFPEVKIVLDFIQNPKFFNPSPFQVRFLERVNLFYGYYISLFPDRNSVLAFFVGILIVVGLVVGYSKFTPQIKRFFRILFGTFIFLFVLSLFYKDNFWYNYYEGLSYFYVLLLALSIYGIAKSKFKAALLSKAPLLLVTVTVLIGLFNLKNDLQKPIEMSGMRSQISVMEYLYNEVGDNEFCVRIYTPPVIPHTYDYLFSYYSQSKGFKSPSHDFINNKCYFIMEKEQEGINFALRIVKWRDENIPKSAVQIKKTQVNEGVAVEVWGEKKVQD